MNALVSEEFGQYFIRLPLNKSAHIVHGNALQLDWNSVIPATQCHYVMGNPPFIGKTYLNDTQRIDVAAIFHDTKNAGLLDYVACWYRKATDYITAHPAIRAAFVSTNSITQGEQVGVLWPDLLRRGVHIHYAHRTFQWMSEAKGKAAVHCVIIGFGLQEATHKTIFEYADIQGESHAITAKNINPYLVDASDVVLDNRTNPICDVPEMLYGNKPVDGGNLLLSSEEKTELLSKEPKAEKWLRPLLGAEEFINGKKRWCLWLVGISPNELRAMPEVMKRVEAVRVFRLKSTKAQTRQHAVTATLFVENRQPENNYILVPRVSSERRLFVPIGFLDCHTISTDLNNMLPNATLYHFGILTSTMHNAWMRTVCGRLKSDYRYSVGIVYNNFPWPEILPNPPLAKGGSVQRGGISAIETAAQAVLDARAQFPDATLADLYDPLAMPPELVRAHQALDRAVDAAYGKKSFASEAERVAFLFERYQAITSLLPANATKKSRNSRH